MTQTTQTVPRSRSLGRRWCSENFQIHTRIIGTIAELHAVHLKTGERFIARATEWDSALHELDQLLMKYGPSEPPSHLATARQRSYSDRIPFVSRFLTSVVRRFRCQDGRNQE